MIYRARVTAERKCVDCPERDHVVRLSPAARPRRSTAPKQIAACDCGGIHLPDEPNHPRSRPPTKPAVERRPRRRRRARRNPESPQALQRQEFIVTISRRPPPPSGPRRSDNPALVADDGHLVALTPEREHRAHEVVTRPAKQPRGADDPVVADLSLARQLRTGRTQKVVSARLTQRTARPSSRRTRSRSRSRRLVGCTWAGFAEAIFEEAGLDCRVRRISTEELRAPGAAPRLLVLCSEKSDTPQLSHWSEGLRECLRRMA